MKLFNTGRRTITHKEGVIKPQDLVTVSDTLGAKLRKMYRGELRSLEDETQKFEASAPAAASTPGAEAPPSVSDAPTSNGGGTPELVDDFEANMTVIDPAEAKEAIAEGISVQELRARKKANA